MRLQGYGFVSGEENRYRYNGIEYTSALGLNFYDTKYRLLDPALGRWMQVDPMVEGFEAWTPYNSNLNNPVINADPDGDCPVLPVIAGATVGGLVDVGFQVAINYAEGQPLSDINWNSVMISAGMGATGVGLGEVVAKGVSNLALRQATIIVGESALDVTESVLKQATDPKNNEGVTLEKTVSDVAFSRLAGAFTKNYDGPMDESLLARQADRTSRIASGDAASAGRSANAANASTTLTIGRTVNAGATEGATGTVENAGQTYSDKVLLPMVTSGAQGGTKQRALPTVPIYDDRAARADATNVFIHR